MTIQAIRDGIATRLATIDGLRTYARPADSFNTPAGIVGAITPSYDETLEGGYNMTAEVLVAVTREPQGLDRATDSLDDYADTAGASSVYAAINGDRTLGGAVSDTRMLAPDPYPEEITLGGKTHAAIRFNLLIMVD